MARWRLINPHYLNTVDPTEWEYTENDRKTGRPRRTKFIVPRYLDPNDPSDWTNSWGQKDNAEGEVVVCHASKGEDRDIEFIGNPTPEMTPLDDEAKAISASFADLWTYKPDGMGGPTYSQSLVDQFQSEMADAQAQPPAPIEVAGLADLLAAMKAQTEAVTAALTTRRI